MVIRSHVFSGRSMTRSLELEIKPRRRAILAALMAFIILLANAIATLKAPAQEKVFSKMPLKQIVIADKTISGLSNAGG